MPITRSRTSSEQSTPETVATGVISGDKETVVKDLKAAAASPELLKSKDDTTNGRPRITDSETKQPSEPEKSEDNGTESAEAKAAPVAGDDAVVTDGDKETAANEEPEKKNGEDAGLHQVVDTEAPANGCARSAVTDSDKTSEVKDANEVQETEAKDLSGDVCAKRKTDDEVSGEADSTCKRNKIEAEPAEQATAN